MSNWDHLHSVNVIHQPYNPTTYQAESYNRYKTIDITLPTTNNLQEVVVNLRFSGACETIEVNHFPYLHTVPQNPHTKCFTWGVQFTPVDNPEPCGPKLSNEDSGTSTPEESEDESESVEFQYCKNTTSTSTLTGSDNFEEGPRKKAKSTSTPSVEEAGNNLNLSYCKIPAYRTFKPNPFYDDTEESEEEDSDSLVTQYKLPGTDFISSVICTSTNKTGESQASQTVTLGRSRAIGIQGGTDNFFDSAKFAALLFEKHSTNVPLNLCKNVNDICYDYTQTDTV